MSMPGEVGKVASSAIDAMKGSPALLAVILLQLTTIGILYFASQANQARAHEREMFLMTKCFPGYEKTSSRLVHVPPELK